MIAFNNVTKSFVDKDGDFKAVDNVSISVKSEEIFGIIGESGAGKSTLMRFINALEKPDAGQIIVDDIDVAALGGRRLRTHQKNVGMIFQQFNLLSNKTVEDNIKLPLELHRYNHPLSLDEVIKFVGLDDKRSSFPAELSGGQKQRVGIARALVTRPEILLCDEPTSALDEKTTEEITDVLRRAQMEFGMTVIIVTHELNVIKQLCDRAAVLEKGKLIDIIDVEQPARMNNEQSYYDRILAVLKNG